MEDLLQRLSFEKKYLKVIWADKVFMYVKCTKIQHSKQKCKIEAQHEQTRLHRIALKQHQSFMLFSTLEIP